MVSFSSIATFALAGLASAASAPETHDSPNVAYTAVLSTQDVQGTFNFTGKGGDVNVDIMLGIVPETGGPFFYYIHESPIPANGTCWDAKGIFNPYNGTYPTGNNSIPASTVALGNFAIDNGYVTNGGGLGAGIAGVGNPYWSLNPNNKAFIGNLSVVFQYWNKTPIACANIVKSETQPSKNGASKMAGAAAALPLAAGVAALLI